MTDVTWEAAVEAFLSHCKGNGLSPSTIDNYQWFLNRGRSVAFRDRHGLTRPAELTADLLEALKLECQEAGLRPASIADYCRVWRVFAKFCIERGWLKSDAILGVKSPRQPKQPPRGFTAEEETAVLNACRCERDRVLVQLILETGLRRAEIANLTLEDVTADGLVRVRMGKGRKDRAVPISESFAVALAHYIATVRPASACPSLFLTSTRTAGSDHGGLTGDGIYRIWYRIRQATGIRAYPHRARHTFATRLAQDGVDPWAIQRALGHTTNAMTQRYVDTAAIDLRAAFAKRPQRGSLARKPPSDRRKSDVNPTARPEPSELGSTWDGMFSQDPPKEQTPPPWWWVDPCQHGEGPLAVMVRCFAVVMDVLAARQRVDLDEILNVAVANYARHENPDLHMHLLRQAVSEGMDAIA